LDWKVKNVVDKKSQDEESQEDNIIKLRVINECLVRGNNLRYYIDLKKEVYEDDLNLFEK
jgi:hypothetical protein